MSEVKKEWVIKKGATYVETILENGKSVFTGKGHDDYPADKFDIVDEDEGIRIIQKNEDEKYIGEWKEITKEEWWDNYECLPPVRDARVGGAHFFTFMEAITGNISSVFCEMRGRWFVAARRTTVNYEDLMVEIHKQFFE